MSAEERPTQALLSAQDMIDITWAGPPKMHLTTITRDQFRLIKSGEPSTLWSGMALFFGGVGVNSLVSLFAGGLPERAQTAHGIVFLVMAVATVFAVGLTVKDRNGLRKQTLEDIERNLG